MTTTTPCSPRRLLNWAGLLAQVIDFYETGAEPAGSLPTLAEVATRFQHELFRLAEAQQIDLVELVRRRLTVHARPANPGLAYDPTTCPARVRFGRLQQWTHCVYARNARVWGAPPFDASLSLEANIAQVQPSLVRFLRVSRREGLDGFVLELPSQPFGSSIASLAEALRRTLTCLSERDPSGRRCMDEPIDRPGWRFAHNGEDLFLTTFAPCYDERNSRYTFGIDGVFIFLVPEHTFDRVLGAARALKVRGHRAVRERYARHGRPYDTEVADGSIETLKYVSPHRVEDGPIRWWLPQKEERFER